MNTYDQSTYNLMDNVRWFLAEGSSQRDCELALANIRENLRDAIRSIAQER